MYVVRAGAAGRRDPLANLGYNSATGALHEKIVANLAPDDTGNPAVHHDYVMTKGGVDSTFVWIPLSTAHQLIVPGNYSAGEAGLWAIGLDPGRSYSNTHVGFRPALRF